MWFSSITEKFLISINISSCSLSYPPSCLPFNLNTPLATILQTVSFLFFFSAKQLTNLSEYDIYQQQNPDFFKF